MTSIRPVVECEWHKLMVLWRNWAVVRSILWKSVS